MLGKSDFAVTEGFGFEKSLLNAFSDALPQEEIDFCRAKKMDQFEKD